VDVIRSDQPRQLAHLRCSAVADDPLARHGALFHRDGARVVPTELARGPWDPNALHGGAPSALFAWACATHDPGPAAFLTRLSVDLLRPVPLAPLELRVRTIRPGHKVHWLEAMLLDAGGREVAHATALRMRTADVDVDGAVEGIADPPPPREVAARPLFPFDEGAIGYWTATEVALVRGNWAEPGPGIAWLRLRCPVIDDEPIAAFERVAAAADFGSGVGNALRFTNSAAINAEVSIHVHRHPIGEWVCLESSSWVQAHGVGLTESRLHDEQGVLGRSAQSLLIESTSRRQFGAGAPPPPADA
jgi:acyl-coenzyme A thioesterase PaaI-like protein